ncbi:MAG: rhamnan synthesis F family protein [Cyanobacteriota bacterium]
MPKLQSSLPPSLSKQFSEFLKVGNIDSARFILDQAIDRHYPQNLISKWELELAAHSYPRHHPLEICQKNGSKSGAVDNDLPHLGGGLREELIDSIHRFYHKRNPLIGTDQILSLVEKTLSSYDPLSRSVQLPDLTSDDPENKSITITELEYLEDNPDIKIAHSKGIVLSPMDHLIRNGYLEIMQGNRACRKFFDVQTRKAKALTIVSDVSFLSDSQINTLIQNNENMAENFVLSVKDMKVIDSNRREMSFPRFLYQALPDMQNLCIRLEDIRLLDSAQKWLSEITLTPKTAIYGHKSIENNPQYALSMSRVNALIDDVTNGCVIVDVLNVLAIVNDLSGYSTAKGFYHALIIALLDSGVTFLHKHEFLCQSPKATHPSAPDLNSYWSPFYWSTSLDDQSMNTQVRKDYVITWQKYLARQSPLQPNTKWECSHLSLRYRFEADPDLQMAIVIPFKDKINLLVDCVHSIFSRRENVRLKVYAVDNNSELEETQEALRLLEEEYPNLFVCLPAPGPFNFSKINNDAVKCVQEEYVLFLNNDILIESDYALTDLMQAHLFFNAVMTGAHLEFPSGNVQHNGLTLCSYSHIAVTSPFKRMRSMADQFASASQQIPSWCKTHECSAVTAACMLIQKDDFLSVGGFDENLTVAYNDVDLCLAINNAFKHRPIICCTDLKIIHLESESRGDDEESLERIARLHHERVYLVDKHAERFESKDPFFPVDITADNPYKTITRFSSVTTPVPISDIDMTNLYFAHHPSRVASKSIAAVFVHYDKTNRISKETAYYIKELSKYTDIFFVSSSEGLSENQADLNFLSSVCKQVIVRKNSGYDFGCWSHVIRENYQTFKDYNGLLLCNDSVFGPLTDLGSIFDQLDLRSGTDFWGLTASITPMWHLQSYFILYSKRIVESAIFQEHWHEIGIHESKFNIIMAYEVGWSDLLVRSGFRGKSLFETETGAQNPTHSSWDRLIDLGFPFIKKELIRDNPLRMSMDALPSILDQSSEPWAEYMYDYLKLYDKSNDVLNQYLGYPS